MTCKKVLVLCNMNRTRSPYITNRLQDYCDEHDVDAYVMSAGIAAPPLDGYTQVTKELVDDADVIFTMDYHTTNEIIKKYIRCEGQGLLRRAMAYDSIDTNMKKLHNLNIPDIFIPEDADSKALEKMRERPDYVMREKYLSGLDDLGSSAYVERMSVTDTEAAVFGDGDENMKNILVPISVLGKALDFRIEAIANFIK